MVKGVSFLTPMIFTPEAKEHSWSNFLVEKADGFFYLGLWDNHKALVQCTPEGKFVATSRIENQALMWVTLKVVAYCTVVFPLIVFIAKVGLRLSYPSICYEEKQETPPPEGALPGSQAQETPPPEGALPGSQAQGIPPSIGLCEESKRQLSEAMDLFHSKWFTVASQNFHPPEDLQVKQPIPSIEESVLEQWFKEEQPYWQPFYKQYTQLLVEFMNRQRQNSRCFVIDFLPPNMMINVLRVLLLLEDAKLVSKYQKWNYQDQTSSERVSGYIIQA